MTREEVYCLNGAMLEGPDICNPIQSTFHGSLFLGFPTNALHMLVSPPRVPWILPTVYPTEYTLLPFMKATLERTTQLSQAQIPQPYNYKTQQNYDYFNSPSF